MPKGSGAMRRTPMAEKDKEERFMEAYAPEAGADTHRPTQKRGVMTIPDDPAVPELTHQELWEACLRLHALGRG
jgi:hypothetical protein